MEKMYRIGEVSKLYHISIDTLRYYDKIGLIKPIVDRDNDYRYYVKKHFDLLEFVLISKDLGIPLKKVKEIIASQDIDGYDKLFLEQRAIIDEKIQKFTQLRTLNEELLVLTHEMKNYKKQSNFSDLQVSTVEKRFYWLPEYLMKEQNDVICDADLINSFILYEKRDERYLPVNTEDLIAVFTGDQISTLEMNLKQAESITNPLKLSQFGKRNKEYTFLGTHSELMNCLVELSTLSTKNTEYFLVEYLFSLYGNHAKDNLYFTKILFS